MLIWFLDLPCLLRLKIRFLLLSLWLFWTLEPISWGVDSSFRCCCNGRVRVWCYLGEFIWIAIEVSSPCGQGALKERALLVVSSCMCACGADRQCVWCWWGVYVVLQGVLKLLMFGGGGGVCCWWGMHARLMRGVCSNAAWACIWLCFE